MGRRSIVAAQQARSSPCSTLPMRATMGTPTLMSPTPSRPLSSHALRFARALSLLHHARSVTSASASASASASTAAPAAALAAAAPPRAQCRQRLVERLAEPRGRARHSSSAGQPRRQDAAPRIRLRALWRVQQLCEAMAEGQYRVVVREAVPHKGWPHKLERAAHLCDLRTRRLTT
eukprot:6202686-Pleurochrysis_carterae.AAC.3